MSIKKKMMNEEKGSAEGIPIKAASKPKIKTQRRVPTETRHSSSRDEFIPGDEELTFKPKINSSYLPTRTYEDKLNWLKQKEEKL